MEFLWHQMFDWGNTHAVLYRFNISTSAESFQALAMWLYLCQKLDRVAYTAWYGKEDNYNIAFFANSYNPGDHWLFHRGLDKEMGRT